VLADNKLALNAGWDRELLALELQGLIEANFEVEITGFSQAEIDISLDEAAESSPNASSSSAPEDEIPSPATAHRSAGLVMCGCSDATV
jgi:hypothetical protein